MEHFMRKKMAWLKSPDDRRISAIACGVVAFIVVYLPLPTPILFLIALILMLCSFGLYVSTITFKGNDISPTVSYILVREDDWKKRNGAYPIVLAEGIPTLREAIRKSDALRLNKKLVISCPVLIVRYTESFNIVKVCENENTNGH